MDQLFSIMESSGGGEWDAPTPPKEVEAPQIFTMGHRDPLAQAFTRSALMCHISDLPDGQARLVLGGHGDFAKAPAARSSSLRAWHGAVMCATREVAPRARDGGRNAGVRSRTAAASRHSVCGVRLHDGIERGRHPGHRSSGAGVAACVSKPQAVSDPRSAPLRAHCNLTMAHRQVLQIHAAQPSAAG